MPHITFWRPAPSLRAYYLRRLTRLEPPYVIAMVLIFLFAIIGYGLPARALWPHLLASLAYVHNLIYGRGSTLNVVAWSLEIEVQFYLLAPLLALVFAIAVPLVRRTVLIAGIAVALLVQAGGAPSDQRVALTLLNFIQFFLLGFLLADLYLTEWRRPSARPGWWDVAGVLGWVSLLAVWVFFPNPGIIFPPLAFLAFCAAFRGNVVKRVLSNRWITTVGGMCYTI